MKKNIILIITLIFPLISLSQEYTDVVHLKNGSIIHGIIIEQVPNETVKIKTADGNIFVYQMEEIAKISKEIEEDKEDGYKPSLGKSMQSGYSGFGLKFGAGTDISLGLGFGVGAFYTTPASKSSSWEFGTDVYYASVSEEDRDIEGTKYDEETKVLVIALRSNILLGYNPKSTGIYFLGGAGIVFANVDWVENITYSAPYVPHTERWSDDAFSIGNVLNLGAGMTFGSGLEVRFDSPLLIFYSTPGSGGQSAASIAPTFTLNLIYRFH